MSSKKKYLIRVETSHTCALVSVYGDSPTRPFSIANNLWNYQTPWTAARRLEKLAKSWERLGYNVVRVFGTVAEMPTKGDAFNVASIIGG